MSAMKRRENNPSQDWQKADARILGQILAAQNVVFALPDPIRIAEFYAQILSSIPGIPACRICLGGRSVQAGEMASGVCAECETLRHLAWQDDTLIPTSSSFKCNLADQPDMRVIPIDSYQHHFGFFVLKIHQAAVGELYQPFIINLANYVALILENRWQKDLLQKARGELERKVEERTHELTAANEALAASRLTALEMMKEAIEARQRAEKASAELEREVAEHKQAELELILREREYRTLIESVPDLIVRYDLDLRRIYVNPAWEKASGLSAAEVIGVAYTDIPRVPSPVVAEYVDKLRQVLKTETAQAVEFTWVNAKGVNLFLEYVIVPEYDHHGTIAGVLAVGRDITERKRAEEKLKASEERLRLTLEATQIGIWDWDLINDRYYASPIYYTMLGYEPKEGPADRSEWMRQLHPDDKKTVLEQVNKVLSRACDEYSYEARFRHADGSYRWQWAFGYGTEHDKDGKLTRMLGLRIDIDKRKQMEKELSIYREHLEELVRERTAELEAANKELDAFAYSVSHDLRAPLRHIDGFIELLQEKAATVLDEKSRRYMEAISESAQKMERLIADLLSFSRMGRRAMSLKRVDLGFLVRDVIREKHRLAHRRASRGQRRCVHAADGAG
jgi:PAS domain S-box-containing protein